MSRFRLSAKLRKNEDFKAITSWLDGQGLEWRVVPPSGKGHPGIEIDLPDGETITHQITCTPRGGGNARAALAYLRRTLRGAGYREI